MARRRGTGRGWVAAAWAALLATAAGCSRSEGNDPAPLPAAPAIASAASPASASAKAAPSVEPAASALALPPSSPPSPTPPPAPAASAAASPPDASVSAAAAGDAAATPPEGYVTMTLLEVAPTDHGHAVLLVDRDEELVLPIFVGGTEGLSISLRHEGRRFHRPLTHDLLDRLLVKLGGELWKVQVDDLRGSTFVGSVFVRQAGRIIEVDARPSDAIALALGSGVPIFVARRVAESAGLRKRDVDGRDRERVLRPIRPPEPIAL